MPLKEIEDLQQACEAFMALIRRQPDVLTDFERLEVETSITRLLSALVQSERTRKQRPDQA